MDDDTDRVEGVDFSNVNSIFGELSYPVTADELVERYGDRELERTNAGPISIRELFDYMGDNTFESEDQLRQMILGQMPQESGGRANYSDRGGSNPTLTDAAEEAEDSTAADFQGGEATDRDRTQQLGPDRRSPVASSRPTASAAPRAT